MHLKFFDNYNYLEVMRLKLIFTSPSPASLTIPKSPLLSKKGRKFQLELLSIYAEKLLHLKFFDNYNCLEVMRLKLIFTSPPPASLKIPVSLLLSMLERKFQLVK